VRGAPPSYGAQRRDSVPQWRPAPCSASGLRPPAAAARGSSVRRAILLGAAALGLVTLGAACFTRIGDPSSPTPEGRPCETDRDCPQPTNPCQVWTCWQQVCTGVAAAKDTLIAKESQVAGDCKVLVCDGQGQTVGIPDKTDEPPADDNPCADEVCEDGAPAYPPVPVGMACGKAGVCNGKGKCGVCLPEDQRCKGNKPETCSEDGDWTSEGPCPAGTPICSGVACIGIAEVVAGGGFSCGRLDDGKVRCFGSPEAGKLGQSGARTISGLGQVKQIAAGATHTCALTYDGVVKCWGSNQAGQLGDETKDKRGYPERVPKLSNVTQIAAGQLFSCALHEGGTVSCWGSNEYGQIGLGTTAKLKSPVSPFPQQTSAQDRPSEVSGLMGAITVSLGHDHGCALLASGGVSCWGSDANQALGRGYPPAAKATPMMVVHPQPKPAPEKALPVVKGLTGAVEIAVGSDHACARLSDGSVSCWGHNHHGQLGDGTTKDAKAPVKVKGLAGASGLALGGDHSCAHLSDGGVSCWGAGASGEVGDPAKADHTEPFGVPGLAGVQGISSGENHVCAHLGDNTHVCWGDNTHGELGSGSTGEKPSPVLW